MSEYLMPPRPGSTLLPRQKSPDRASVSHTRINDDVVLDDLYEVGQILGQGTFGKVYEATHKKTGEKWAVKSINKEKAGSAALKLVEREVGILKVVKHKHIINLYEVLESPKRMYLILELCKGGELANEIKRRKSLTETVVREIMSSLTSAIAYLHKNDIVHRDIKLENILLLNDPKDKEEDWTVKVTDFGLSIFKGGSGGGNMLQAFCGTPIYMAPEILENKTYSQQCDVWALGVLMYILIAGHPPFYASDDEALYELIRKAEIDYSEDVWDNFCAEAKSCINGMLTIDPAHRLTAAEICEHKFITGRSTTTLNVLSMMKEYHSEMQQNGKLPLRVEDSDGSNQSSYSSFNLFPEKKDRANTVTDQSDNPSKKATINQQIKFMANSPSSGKALVAKDSKKTTHKSLPANSKKGNKKRESAATQSVFFGKGAGTSKK